MDYIAAAREFLDEDIVSGILIASVLSANVNHIDQRPENIRNFSGAGSIPDADRKPVNALSIAASIGIPRETTRLKLLRLLQSGVLRKVGDGLILPSETIRSPRFQASLPAFVQAMEDFVGGLILIEAFGLEPGHRLARPIAPVAGVSWRLIAAHVVRGIHIVRAIKRDRPFHEQYLLSAVSHLTGANLRVGHTGETYEGPLRGLAPSMTPVRGADVARFTEQPAETVRRQLLSLQQAGDLQRTKAGYDVPLGDPERVRRWSDFHAYTEINTRQLIWKLRLAGVIITS